MVWVEQIKKYLQNEKGKIKNACVRGGIVQD